ncbi:hypothetical protein B0H10DRAFT_2137581 [Mycena sp. CBHHK59/15]|nr:hypothetical protein B0H10DRAFT_2137581 [Mycena sp. CBHHK59/15]
MEPYSALPNQPPPSEGTVASLRHASLGDRHAGPLMSTPRSMSINPVSPALSVSPPASPRQLSPVRAFDPTLHQAGDSRHSLFLDQHTSTRHRSSTHDRRTSSPSASHNASLAGRLSIGVDALSVGGREIATLSRSHTPRAGDGVQAQSPSTDTVREELSVLNMMELQASETQSSIVLPIPLPLADQRVPSSVTPSPMLASQLRTMSPPPLKLSIPRSVAPAAVPSPALGMDSPLFPPSTPTFNNYPSATDLFERDMSPLSPAPSTPASEIPPSPSTQMFASLRDLSPATPSVKTERKESDSIPSSQHQRRSEPVLKRRPLAGLAPAASAAATRVKKRKAKPREPESDEATPEPPPKRSRQQRAHSEKKEPVPVVKKEKAKKKSANSLPQDLWPPVTDTPGADQDFIRKLIGCDRCSGWYHCGCLGIVPGDPRIDASVFHCPPCAAGYPSTTADPEATEGTCQRPGCSIRGYTVAGIYGRYTKFDNTLGRLVWWLVRWEGYPWKDSTWETEEASHEEFIDEFRKRAVAEGIDLEDDSRQCILLRKAVAAGVKSPVPA